MLIAEGVYECLVFMIALLLSTACNDPGDVVTTEDVLQQLQ